MQEFDIGDLFEYPGVLVREEGFGSVAEAYNELVKSQLKDIIRPQRTIAEIIKFLGGKIILRYKINSSGRIIDTELSYDLDQVNLENFLSFLGDGNLPKIGKCLVCANFGTGKNISIYERDEAFGKKLVDSQGDNEKIFFVSRNFPKRYSYGEKT